MREGFLIVMIGILAVPLFLQAESLTVQVREAKLKARPEVWAPTVETLLYGVSVEASGPDNGWYTVLTPSKNTGFLHQSGVSTRTLSALQQKVRDTTSDAADVTLAGKGFSDKVFAAYVNDKKVDPSLVDVAEKQQLSSEKTLQRFAQEGKLSIGGTR